MLIGAMLNSAEYARILNEINAHPKERNGFSHDDFLVLQGAAGTHPIFLIFASISY